MKLTADDINLSVELEGQTITIGRDDDNTIVLPKENVSRHHAQIYLKGSSYFLRDLGSTNGTFLDQSKIAGEMPIAPGNTIQIGSFNLEISDEAATIENPFLKLKTQIREKLLCEPLLKEINFSKTPPEQLEKKVVEAIENILAGITESLPPKTGRDRLIKELLNETLGLGPLEDFLHDPSVTEIMVNGKDCVYIERDGKLELTACKFISDEQVLSVIEKIIAPLGRRIDESVPLVDARLKDGSRVNAIIAPLTLSGPTLTIRRFRSHLSTAEELVKLGSISTRIGEFLRICVEAHCNIIISGGTGSGKTTLLNILAGALDENERIITIEDAAELNLPQGHVVRLESRPPNIEGRGKITIRDLVRNALRMRPDRIIIGECRGEEALDMLQAMNTGHDGSITTVHANSPRDSLSRLETMVLMSGIDLPSRAIREQIASAIQIIIHISRYDDGKRRLSCISEITGMEGEVITLQDIFAFKEEEGQFAPTGFIPRFIERRKEIDRGIFR